MRFVIESDDRRFIIGRSEDRWKVEMSYKPTLEPSNDGSDEHNQKGPLPRPYKPPNLLNRLLRWTGSKAGNNNLKFNRALAASVGPQTQVAELESPIPAELESPIPELEGLGSNIWELDGDLPSRSVELPDVAPMSTFLLSSVLPAEQSCPIIASAAPFSLDSPISPVSPLCSLASQMDRKDMSYFGFGTYSFTEPLPPSAYAPFEPALQTPLLACEYGDQAFNGKYQRGNRMRHMRQKHAPLSCEHCDQVFYGQYQKGDLTRHTKHKHAVSPGMLKCHICPAVYKREDARKKHEWKKHRVETARPKKRRPGKQTCMPGSSVLVVPAERGRLGKTDSPVRSCIDLSGPSVVPARYDRPIETLDHTLSSPLSFFNPSNAASTTMTVFPIPIRRSSKVESSPLSTIPELPQAAIELDSSAIPILQGVLSGFTPELDISSPEIYTSITSVTEEIGDVVQLASVKRSISCPMMAESSCNSLVMVDETPQRSISAPWPCDPVKEEFPTLTGTCLPLNGVSVYYSGKTEHMSLDTDGRSMNQATNGMALRTEFTQLVRSTSNTMSRSPSACSWTSAFSCTIRINATHLHGLPFATLMRSTSQETSDFATSAKDFFDVRYIQHARERPRHRFRAGKISVSARASVMPKAYPPVRCQHCSATFTGQNRRRSFARHRRQVHGRSYSGKAKARHVRRASSTRSIGCRDPSSDCDADQHSNIGRSTSCPTNRATGPLFLQHGKASTLSELLTSALQDCSTSDIVSYTGLHRNPSIQLSPCNSLTGNRARRAQYVHRRASKLQHRNSATKKHYRGDCRMQECLLGGLRCSCCI